MLSFVPQEMKDPAPYHLLTSNFPCLATIYVTKTERRFANPVSILSRVALHLFKTSKNLQAMEHPFRLVSTHPGLEGVKMAEGNAFTD
ncbi:MAG: hypothetical protein V7K21_22270 [Nostoc sp.]|uniref:hypothetical protein n=1 Tax=Nostoc sp. TaxID=1180 RepID=UPI002FFA80D9